MKSIQNKKENKKSPNQGERVQPDICWGIDNYINLLFPGREWCKATVAQSGRAPASRAGVQPDIRVQTLNQDESPGGGAQINSLFSAFFTFIASIITYLISFKIIISNYDFFH